MIGNQAVQRLLRANAKRDDRHVNNFRFQEVGSVVLRVVRASAGAGRYYTV